MDSILLNPGDPVQDFSLRLSVSAGGRNTYQVASADLVTSAAEHVGSSLDRKTNVQHRTSEHRTSNAGEEEDAPGREP